jgi:acyl dehydratase
MRRWILAALVVALAVGAAVAYAETASKRYEAVSRVVVHPVPAGDDLYAGIDVLRDSQDSARVLETAQTYFETEDVRTAAAARAGTSVRTVREHVDVRPLEGTNVVEVVGKDKDPVRAAGLANAVRQEGIAQRTARFQAEVASVLDRLSKFGSVEARRRVVDLRALQGRSDPTLETLTVATAPSDPSWPDDRVIIPAGVGIGLGLAALVVLLPPLFRKREVEVVYRRDEEHERGLADREQALQRRSDAIAQRERELAAAVESARKATTSGDELQRRVAAITQRELQTARRAAELAERERQLEQVAQRLDARALELDNRERELGKREAEPPPAPAPEPEPAVVAEEPTAPEPAQAASRGGWTIQDLERLVQEHGAEHPDRIDEWRYYVHFLREHTDVDGRLPASFDYLVEETFDELLRR